MRKLQRRGAQPARYPVVNQQPSSRSSLAARYAAVRRATEQLVRPLTAEDCALQSMPDASPAK